MVNNAGISARDSLYDYNPEDFDRIMDLNVNSVFRCSKAAAAIMREHGGGVILNTSSMVSFYGQPAGSGYPASKFALNGLTKFSGERAWQGSYPCQCGSTGVTRTDMMEAVPQEVIEPIVRTIPLGRLGGGGYSQRVPFPGKRYGLLYYRSHNSGRRRGNDLSLKKPVSVTTVHECLSARTGVKKMNTMIFRDMSYGVYVTTSMDGNRPVGCITNSIMQITSDPATIAVSVNHDNYTNSCIDKTGKFAFSILSEKSDPSIIGTFGFHSCRDTDKFSNVDYEMAAGLPVIKGFLRLCGLPCH